MIDIRPLNTLFLSIEGFSDRSVSLSSQRNSMSVSIVPFFKGKNAVWTSISQVDYDALPIKDPSTLYLITG